MIILEVGYCEACDEVIDLKHHADCPYCGKKLTALIAQEPEKKEKEPKKQPTP